MLYAWLRFFVYIVPRVSFYSLCRYAHSCNTEFYA